MTEILPEELRAVAKIYPVKVTAHYRSLIREAGGDDDGSSSLIVTPKEVDLYVRDAAKVIAAAIERLSKA